MEQAAQTTEKKKEIPYVPRDVLTNVICNDVSDYHKFYINYKNSARIPEHDLILSILELSLYEYTTLCKKYKAKNFKRQYEELYNWFFNPNMNKDYVFNFTNICEYLHIEKDIILKRLKLLTND